MKVQNDGACASAGSSTVVNAVQRSRHQTDDAGPDSGVACGVCDNECFTHRWDYALSVWNVDGRGLNSSTPSVPAFPETLQVGHSAAWPCCAHNSSIVNSSMSTKTLERCIERARAGRVAFWVRGTATRRRRWHARESFMRSTKRDDLPETWNAGCVNFRHAVVWRSGFSCSFLILSLVSQPHHIKHSFSRLRFFIVLWVRLCFWNQL